MDWQIFTNVLCLTNLASPLNELVKKDIIIVLKEKTWANFFRSLKLNSLMYQF